MKLVLRAAAVLVGASLGLALCIAAIRIDEALHLLPRLPTPGGEDDFSVRAALFFGGTCPAFALLGGYLGWLAAREPGRALRAALGVVLATMACFGAVGVFPAAMLWIARTSLGGTGAFGVFLALWFACSLLLTVTLGRRRTT